MKFIYSFTIILVSLIQVGFAQVDYSQEWKNSGWKFAKEEDSIVDVTQQVIQNYDFSRLFLIEYPMSSSDSAEPKPLHGIFGKHNSRIEMFFSDVQPSSLDITQFLVSGKTKLKNNICDFSGHLQVQKVTAYIPPRTEEGRKKTVVVVTGSYELNENAEQKGSGRFQGTFKIILWTEDVNASPIVFDMDAVGEEGAVKAFVGTWKKYKSDKPAKKCIWGFERFPNQFVKDFDQGAGEPCINIKYAKTWFDFTTKEWEDLRKKGTSCLNIFQERYIPNKESQWHKK